MFRLCVIELEEGENISCYVFKSRNASKLLNTFSITCRYRYCNHSYLRADAQPVEKGRPVELKFKLMPTSFKFLKGQVMQCNIS